MDRLSELCDSGCMGEVMEIVAILLIARLVVGNLVEICKPLVKRCARKSSIRVTDQSQLLTDYNLSEVSLDGVCDEYMEMTVQFAFIVLFIMALPVSPLICFLNSLLEIRVNAINMLEAHRRPVSIRASTIGIWNNFLDIVLKTGIVCNAALLAFMSDYVPRFYCKYFYESNKSSGGGLSGYTKFSLSEIPAKMWTKEIGDAIERENSTGCWYPDFRRSYAPFLHRNEYWQILSLRLTVFIGFALTFFVIMWFVNAFVGDVLYSVETKLRRRKYLVSKALDAEFAKIVEQV